jgi:hypothetical protein
MYVCMCVCVPVRLCPDKEMAEQKAETLAQEVEDLKIRLEEAMLELELAKSGADEDDGGDGGAGGGRAPAEQLEKQIERLKEALVKVDRLPVSPLLPCHTAPSHLLPTWPTWSWSMDESLP